MNRPLPTQSVNADNFIDRYVPRHYFRVRRRVLRTPHSLRDRNIRTHCHIVAVILVLVTLFSVIFIIIILLRPFNSVILPSLNAT